MRIKTRALNVFGCWARRPRSDVADDAADCDPGGEAKEDRQTDRRRGRLGDRAEEMKELLMALLRRRKREVRRTDLRCRLGKTRGESVKQSGPSEEA